MDERDHLDTSEYAEAYVDAEGQHRWRIKAMENDNVLGDSGQGYSNHAEMISALGRVTHRVPWMAESKTASVASNAIRVVRVGG